MDQTIVEKYARLIVEVGANVQQGQTVRLYINADQYRFAELITEACYKAGAARVDVEWLWQPLEKLDYAYQSLDMLSQVPAWKEEKMKLMAKELPCRIIILSDDPDGLAGVDQEKMQKSMVAQYPIIKPYRDAIENRHQWTIAAVPSPPWAKKVFPDLPEDAAVEALWKAILQTVHVTADNDPVAEWQAHNKNFAERCAWLNARKFDSLTYKSANGTDFTVGLIPQGHWCGGCDTTIGGVSFNPNLPTEEIFTSPMKGKAEGKLVSTKPLSFKGQLIENFSLTFENGKVVSCQAEKGQELLEKMVSMDEGAAMLGEVALIPCDSPINNSGVLYFETLFDENASCHVALGAGFNDTIDGYETLSNEECQALGINESMIHVDFMIGAPDLDITGYKNGEAFPIFRKGEWAF